MPVTNWKRKQSERALRHAVARRDVDSVRQLLIPKERRKARLAAAKQHVYGIRGVSRSEFEIPWEWTSDYENSDMVQMLIQDAGIHHFDINVNASELDHYNGKTALHLAAEHGMLDTVQLLISVNANVEERDIHGESALHKACRGGKVAIVKLIIEHSADIEVKSNSGKTPLYLAIAFGYLGIVEILIEHNANIESRDSNGRTLLHTASSIDSHHVSCNGIVKLLIEKNTTADFIEAKDDNGQTALHIASALWNCTGDQWIVDRVRMLIEHNANVKARDNNGETALHIAIGNSMYDIAELLIEHCADLEAKDNLGETALHRVCGKMSPLNDSRKCDMIRVFIDHNINLEAKNNNGQTALHIATQNHCGEIITMLIDHKAYLEAQTNTGQTAFHIAVQNALQPSDSDEIDEIVKLLIDYKANVNAKDNLGETALHIASRHGFGHVEIVNCLIAYGANLQVANNNGQTAFHLAAHSMYNSEVARLLLEAELLVGFIDNTQRDVFGTTKLEIVANRWWRDFAWILLRQQFGVKARWVD
jgi:ankyrin repeat protein